MGLAKKSLDRRNFVNGITYPLCQAEKIHNCFFAFVGGTTALLFQHTKKWERASDENLVSLVLFISAWFFGHVLA
jgi:hypothetical protein